MSNMVLGSVTFSRDPAKMTVIKAERVVAVVETYSGIEFFTWGTFLAGKKLELYFPGMVSTEFDAIQALIEADAQVVFNPQTGSTYNVEIVGLDGDYHMSKLSSDDVYRKEVTVHLLIISEV